MQSSDQLGNIVQSGPIDTSKAEELAARIKAAEQAGAIKHVIGKLPRQDETVVINGIQYRVDFADYVKGKFVVKLTCRER